jgi:hypothetical protein
MLFDPGGCQLLRHTAAVRFLFELKHLAPRGRHRSSGDFGTTSGCEDAAIHESHLFR